MWEITYVLSGGPFVRHAGGWVEGLVDFRKKYMHVQN